LSHINRTALAVNEELRAMTRKSPMRDRVAVTSTTASAKCACSGPLKFSKAAPQPGRWLGCPPSDQGQDVVGEILLQLRSRTKTRTGG
jgi:hypothetical protein